MDLSTVEIIGGMRPLDGAAPFASASLIVRERGAPDVIGRISRYEEEGRAIVEPLTREEWRTLCAAEHAHELAEPVPVQMGARMWLLRQSFHGREVALAELRAEGVILDLRHDARTDTHVLVVRENDANRLRDGWARQAFERAEEQARVGRWERALVHAEQAYVVGRGPVAPHWALLALCYERVGRGKRAEGMIQVARRSHGAAFADDVVALRKTIEAQLAVLPPVIARTASGSRGSPFPEIRKAARRSQRDTLENLNRGKAA